MTCLPPGAPKPDRLTEVRPQERVLLRTVEQNFDVVTFPFLDVLEPQMAEQLVEVPTEPGYALAVLASKVFSRREHAC